MSDYLNNTLGKKSVLEATHTFFGTNLPVVISIGCLVVLSSHQSFAGGFRIPESSVEGIALSDALVADPVSSGAFTYNYSSMAFHEGMNLSIDGVGVFTNSSVSPNAPNAPVGSVDNQSDDAFLPSLYFTQGITDKYSWGIHLGVPFGLESVWPVGTFSQFVTADTVLGAGGAIAGMQPTDSSLELFNVSPSFGIKLGDNASVALGIDYYNIKSVELNTLGSQTKGDGDDFGWNASFMYNAAPWSFGASYHSKSEIDIDGNISIAGLGTIPAKTSLTLPYRFQIGVRNQLSENLAVEFDIERTGWSSYDQTVLTSSGGFIPAGTVLSTTTNDWKDITNLRLGLTWSLNSNTDLLFGTGYEETPQPDEHFDSTIADADRYMLSIGITHKLADGWKIKGGYQYGWLKDRAVSGQSYINQVASSGGTNLDPNGTDLYNGEYEGEAHLLGVGVTKSF
jgi:long-chain fatty acid transport protein